ncbi:dihydrofolate reductase family protein [Tsukamurella sp. 1534]|uniref:dihydrofolate reductase family protein n=1 Tax=Tsukamurella sp. 1534 TaxID=1151061 RepID=UPI0002FEDDC3|nr:dihydrofolate reductase family protein [Tsukamurella sp. 1534]
MATYTYDVFMTLDGYGAGDVEGYWGKQGPELLAHRALQYEADQLMVFGARTYREMAAILAEWSDPDLWVARMCAHPLVVPSKTLNPADVNAVWPDTSVVAEDAVELVTRLKAESSVPLRSHGSVAMNRSLMAAGLVDVLQVTVFPMITGRIGAAPVFRQFADFDLELIESHVLDGRSIELRYRPTPL